MPSIDMMTGNTLNISMLRATWLLAAALSVAACGGGGGGDTGGGGTGPTVTISGKITFDRVPFKPTLGRGLDFAAVVESPARQVVVEAVKPASALSAETVLASTTTDTAGDYSLQVAGSQSILIRAKAQMLKTGAAPTWNFRILNNTNGDALYVLDSVAFDPGTANQTRSLRATTGWGGASYTGTRAAAPFAILDTLYNVKGLILSTKADTVFPALETFWSTQNRPSDFFCPDSGDVFSSLYTTFGPNDLDECSTPTPGRSGIYILGNFQIGDTDEFDQHVIAHEAGHGFEDQFSRSDSIGGDHGSGDRLDLRVAFGEGWGNAFGAMVLNDPVYRDSSSGASFDSGFNLESSPVTNPGWYSEFAIHKFLWDLFDPANEPGIDDVALGFVPIYNVMTTTQPGTDALTSIFPFAKAMKANNPAVATGINTLLAAQNIATTSDDFASGEPTVPGSNVTPIYTTIASASPVSLCGSAAYGGEYNKISNRRFLAFLSTSARPITITSTVTSSGSGAAADPDIVVWRRGSIVAMGDAVGNQEVLPVTVQTGTYVIEVYDYNHIDNDPATGTAATCMTVSVAG